MPVATAAATAGDLAAAAYAALAAGDRRAAVGLFDAALAAGNDPRAAAWRAARGSLVRRWSGSAYAVLRAAGDVDLAVTPVLGGGQSGAALAWTPDPLARRPLALTARAAVAHAAGRDRQAAVGLGWHVRPGLTLAAERLFRPGGGAWTLRAAGGAATTRGGVATSAYGEAGVVGRAVYAAAQGRVVAPATAGRLAVGPSLGAWASIEHAGRSVARVDLGPGIDARLGGFALAVDYRVRVAGNAAPASGPVVTLSTAF